MPGKKKPPGSPPEFLPLLDCLLLRYPDSNRTRIRKWLRDGRVSVDGQIASDPRLPVGREAKITLGASATHRSPQAGRGIRILYEDEALIVIEKEAGLLSVPAPGTARQKSAYSLLEEYLGRPPVIVHRLDRDTSGVMIFAKTREVRDALQAQWHETVEDRRYLALVEGCPQRPSGTLVSWLKENAAQKVYATDRNVEGTKKAILHYRVLRQGRFSLVEIQLETGRKNQIRAQFEELGNPVAGDAKYGARTDPIGRLALHATSIRFRHPDGRSLEFESPPPPMFRDA